MFGVKGRKTTVASGTMEKHHIAEHALGIQHAGEQITPKLGMEFGRSSAGVSAIGTEIELKCLCGFRV